jgi:hypothetical protein
MPSDVRIGVRRPHLELLDLRQSLGRWALRGHTTRNGCAEANTRKDEVFAPDARVSPGPLGKFP